MDLLKTGPALAPDALRALTSVARAASNGLGPPQRAMLDATQRVVLGTDLDLESLKPIESEALARRLDDPAQARQLVRLMVALCLADGPPSEEQMSLVSAFATALHVEEPSVGVIAHLAKGRRLRFRLAFLRRSHIRSYLRNTYRLLGGIRPMIRGLLVARGALREDSELASRYRALEQLPPDTLGHAFFHHYTGAGLAFPGEKGGFPVGALFHDFSHVLAQGDHDFFTALFAIVIHTAGINLAPFPMPVLPGRIGQGSLALDVFRALERGAAMKVDLGNDWDFWEYVGLPLEVARQRLGVPALDAHAVA
jgi:hypothetical protein